jgi:opacity protein-like surface antigen
MKKKIVAAAVMAVALAGVGTAPALAQGLGGKGTALCRPAVRASGNTPAGGPGYTWDQAPPANSTAVERFCGSGSD